jgi:hypothetical protein
MPFHSDADEFPEEAFEEATKVRSLEELVAQTAGPAPSMARDDRRSGPVGRALPPPADPSKFEAATRPVALQDRESNPALPSPPEARPIPANAPPNVTLMGTGPVTAPTAPALGSNDPARQPGRLLDTSPSPRTEPRTGAASVSPPVGVPRSREPSLAPGAGSGGAVGQAPRTSGRIPAMPSDEPAPRPSGRIPVVAAEPLKTPKGSRGPLIAILALLLVAVGAAAVWFFVLRTDGDGDDATKSAAGRPGSAGSAAPGSAAVTKADGSGTTGSGSATKASGSAGSAGSVGSAGSAVTPPSGVALVDTMIAATADKATVVIIGTDQEGPAPLTAKLEKGKAYKARVQAPGFVALEVDVKGGGDKVTAKLVAKPRSLHVATSPAGASIFIDNAATSKVTPATIELTRAQAAKPKLHLTLRRPGYKQIDQIIDDTQFTEDVAELVYSYEGKLEQVEAGGGGGNVARPGGGGTARPPTGSGSATPASGSGTGSAGPASGSGAGAGDTPGDKPTDKPTDRPMDKPADKPTDKPTDKPADKPTDKPADKPADKPTDKPGGEPAPDWSNSQPPTP